MGGVLLVGLSASVAVLVVSPLFLSFLLSVVLLVSSRPPFSLAQTLSTAALQISSLGSVHEAARRLHDGRSLDGYALTWRAQLICCCRKGS